MKVWVVLGAGYEDAWIESIYSTLEGAKAEWGDLIRDAAMSDADTRYYVQDWEVKGE